MKEKGKLNFIVAMLIFSTIGIFVRYISLPSSFIAFSRGIIGFAVILLVMILKKQKSDKAAIKENLVLLVVSGGFIGINWVALFESYRYTTVATATLCYYLAPMFVILASPLVFRERLTLKKIICLVTALAGMVLVSGVFESGSGGENQFKGIVFGITAAIFYASVMIMNKKMKEIPAFDKTYIQLLCAGLVVGVYTLFTVKSDDLAFDISSILLLFFVGAFHTGFAYTLYFGSMKGLRAQSVAILSYIDPVFALVLSALILKEHMSLFGFIGAVMVLGSAFVCDLPEKMKISE
ncbi:MAG: EamA family transporter [Clostridia bacterium]|nr:EamA family transporter [Clostridia bacterium]